MILAIAIWSAVTAAEPTLQLSQPRAIEMQISDATGKPLPGVTVSLLLASEVGAPSDFKASNNSISRTLQDGGRLKIADADGRAEFSSLATGTYYIRLELTGFLTQTIGPVAIGDKCVRLQPLKIVLQSWVSGCF